jgi:hypothetical protein
MKEWCKVPKNVSMGKMTVTTSYFHCHWWVWYSSNIARNYRSSKSFHNKREQELQSETTCEMNQFTPLINLSWLPSNLTSTFFFPFYTQVKTWKWTCTKVCTRNLFSSLIGSNLFLPQWCTQDLLLLKDQKKWCTNT